MAIDNLFGEKLKVSQASTAFVEKLTIDITCAEMIV
jgi:hypothetical protein